MSNIIYENETLEMAILGLLKSRNTRAKHLATQCGIHSSYLSRFLKGQANLSQNQVFKISQFFELPPNEYKFLRLLWNYSIAEDHRERTFFKKQILEFKNQMLSVSNKAPSSHEIKDTVKHGEYYRSSVTAIIHIHLTLPKFRLQPKLILSRLGISPEKLESELNKLAELKLIKMKNGNIIHVEDTIHLPENSELSTQNHINWRLQCIHEMQTNSLAQSDYHLSAAFSCTEETKFKIKQLLRDTVIKVRSLVQEDKQATEVYKIHMDLY